MTATTKAERKARRDAIYKIIRRAALYNKSCPTNPDIARRAGTTLHCVDGDIRALEAGGYFLVVNNGTGVRRIEFRDGHATGWTKKATKPANQLKPKYHPKPKPKPLPTRKCHGRCRKRFVPSHRWNFICPACTEANNRGGDNGFHYTSAAT